MIRITIRTDNAAFQDGNRAIEVARILADISRQLHQGLRGMPLRPRDVNGNTVGEVKLTGKDKSL